MGDPFIASIMMETDYYEKGYTLDYLGIGQMSKEEMLNYLKQGIYMEPKK